MACLSKERNDSYRIHWKFKVKLGPRAGEIIEGSLHLGRCTKTAAKAKQREIEGWEDRVKTGRFVPDRGADDVFRIWLRERELTCTPQTLERSTRTMARYRAWREASKLPCDTIEQLAVREDIIRWRDVDFVLERRGGGIVGIDVKAAVKLSGDDFKGLADLAETVGQRFLAGVVLYQGTTTVPFGPNRWAIPLDAIFAG